MTTLVRAAVVALLAATAAPAVAATALDFSFSFQHPAGDTEFITGRGTLALEQEAGSADTLFRIADITGVVDYVWDGRVINSWAITGLNDFLSNRLDADRRFVGGPGFGAGLSFDVASGFGSVSIEQVGTGFFGFAGEVGNSATFTLSAPAGAVPEPATWAMMIAGFGLAGTVLRRRPRIALAG